MSIIQTTGNECYDEYNIDNHIVRHWNDNEYQCECGSITQTGYCRHIQRLIRYCKHDKHSQNRFNKPKQQ